MVTGTLISPPQTPPEGANELGELLARVRRLEQENLRLREQSQRDELTGLANRRCFDERLQQAFSFRRRVGGPLSLIAIDLDHFKPLNDRHGHAAGDLALRAVADVLRRSTRSTDLSARLGGDELAVILPATDGAGARLVAERIRAGIEELRFGHGARLSASIGVSTMSERAPLPSVAALAQAADAAMYAAKRARNAVAAGAALPSPQGAGAALPSSSAAPADRRPSRSRARRGDAAGATHLRPRESRRGAGRSIF